MSIQIDSRRVADIAVSSAALVVLALPLAFAMAAMALTTRENPIYRQQRVGFKGRPFEIYKIRSMKSARDAEGRLILNQGQPTRLGALLRSCSGDEMLQLWNILKGDMSLVGPRPMIAAEEPSISKWDERYKIRPGLMGWRPPLKRRLANRPRTRHVLAMILNTFKTALSDSIFISPGPL